MVYKIIGITHVVYIDPLDLGLYTNNRLAANRIPETNYVTGGFITWEAVFKNGVRQPYTHSVPISIMAYKGKVICNRQPHIGYGGKKFPAGTLIVYNDGTVKVKQLTDLNKETNVHCAIGGCTILPSVLMKEEGFCRRLCVDGKVRDFSDIGRTTNRPVIGYNPTTNKVIVAVRSDSNIGRGRTTLLNLGCTIGITLDAGGSTILKVGNKFKFSTARQLFGYVTWR